jgi:hypothetical protein
MKSLKFMTLLASLILAFIACNNSAHNKSMALNKDLQVKQDFQVNEKKEESPAISYGVQDQTVAAMDSTAIASEGRPEENKNEQNQKKTFQRNTHETKINWDKKIIKTANLNLEVKDYRAFNSLVHQTVKQFGGYVSQEEQIESAYKIENTVAIKVPVDQFEDAMSTLGEHGEKIIEKKITSEDVTTEMVDTKSRIEAKKEVRLRYLDLLKQAKNMKEILEVQNEVNEIQEQLESAAGRVEYLNHSSAFSTINLTFYQVIDAGAVVEQEPTYLHKVTESFSEGLKLVGNLLLGLVSLWPLLTLVTILLIAYKKRRSAKIKVA